MRFDIGRGADVGGTATGGGPRTGARTARGAVALAVAGLALVGCGVRSGAAAQPAAASRAHQGNGVLKVGTLLPETGSLVLLGPPEIAGVKLAVSQINEDGGVLGHPVELDEADSGDTGTDIASQSVGRLLNDGVDAVVGAAASSVTLTVIDKITGSGVLQISPSNTSTRLSGYPAHGLYFRTAASDIYQGRVLAQTALDDGAQTLGILALQDAYGTALADGVASAFTDDGGKVAGKSFYDPTATDFSADVARMKSADPDAIAVIGFAESGVLLEEMFKQGLLPMSHSHKHIYLVDGNMSNTIPVPAGTLDGVKGTIQGADPSVDFRAGLRTIDPALTVYSYAAEAYDAVSVLALAAEAAHSDYGPQIARHMRDVTGAGGRDCHSFAACRSLLDAGVRIDYVGQSGPIDFDAGGDRTVASIGVYQFGPHNTYHPLKFVTGPVNGAASTRPAP